MGITYGLEVVNRYETNILNTAVQVMLCHPLKCCGGFLHSAAALGRGGSRVGHHAFEKCSAVHVSWLLQRRQSWQCRRWR